MSEVLTYEDLFVISPDRDTERVEDTFDTVQDRQDSKDVHDVRDENAHPQLETISIREQILRDVGGLDGELSPDSSGSARSDYFDGKELFHESGESITKVVEETCSAEEIAQHHTFLEYLRGGSKEAFIFQWTDETSEGQVLKMSVATIGENGAVNYEPWMHTVTPEPKESLVESSFASDLDLDSVDLAAKDLDLASQESIAENADEDVSVAQEVEATVSVNEEIEQKLEILFADIDELKDSKSEISLPERPSIADLLVSSIGYSPDVISNDVKEQVVGQFSTEVSKTVVADILELEQVPVSENGEAKQLEALTQQTPSFQTETISLRSEIKEELETKSAEYKINENVVVENFSESTGEIPTKESVIIENEEVVSIFSSEMPHDLSKPEINKQEIISKDTAVSTEEVRISTSTLEINANEGNQAVSESIELIPVLSVPTEKMSSISELSQIQSEIASVESSQTVSIAAPNLEISKAEILQDQYIFEPAEPTIRENISRKVLEELTGVRLVTVDKSQDRTVRSEVPVKVVEVSKEVPSKQVRNEKISLDFTRNSFEQNTSARSNEVLRALDSSLVEEVKNTAARIYAPEHLGRRTQGIFYLGDDVQSAANEVESNVVSTRDGITMRIAA